MIAVGIFLLLLACINYINLNTAQVPSRSKDIGVRKTLGCNKRHLTFQIIIESWLTVSLALLLSFLLSKIAFAYFDDMIPQGVRDHSSPTAAFIFIIALLLITTCLSAAYPAWLINKIQPISIFRMGQQLQVGSTQINIRKALIVFQFFIAQFFTVSALIIGQQLAYTLHKDLGFEKDAVVLFNFPNKLAYKFYDGKIDIQKKKTLVQEIANIKGVSGVSLGTIPLTNSYSSSLFSLVDTKKQDKVKANIFFKNVDDSYIKVYDMKLLAGKNLPVSDTTNSYVINESAVKAFGFKSAEDALGKYIGQGNDTFPIIGVIKDFHAQDFYTGITPLALRNFIHDANSVSIKLAGKSTDWPYTLKEIEAQYKSFFPEYPTELKFFDENIAALYQKEQNLAKLINCSTAIAIFIGCLGLFGLVTLAAFQRTKEIGIRKVLGATIPNIFQLLAKNFLQLIFLSLILSTPLIWWIGKKWLENFTYRIDISIWPFVIGGGIALLAALLTISYQSIKAATANPVDALRDE